MTNNLENQTTAVSMETLMAELLQAKNELLQLKLEQAQSVTNNKEDKSKIYAAFAKAQAEFKPVVESQTANAGKFSYTYATLADTLAATVPALNKYEIAFSQEEVVTNTTNGGQLLQVVTVLMHSSGQVITSKTHPLLYAQNNAQSAASTLSYLRRYGANSLLGIAPLKDEDDAQIAMYANGYTPYGAQPDNNYNNSYSNSDNQNNRQGTKTQNKPVASNHAQGSNKGQVKPSNVNSTSAATSHSKTPNNVQSESLDSSVASTSMSTSVASSESTTRTADQHSTTASQPQHAEAAKADTNSAASEQHILELKERGLDKAKSAGATEEQLAKWSERTDNLVVIQELSHFVREKLGK
nr:ERF family protein [Streptococcus gallolyticus]